MANINNVPFETLWKLSRDDSTIIETYPGSEIIDPDDGTSSIKNFATQEKKTSDYVPVFSNNPEFSDNNNNKVIIMNVQNGGNLIIPTNASQPFPIGSTIRIYNYSAKLLTIRPINNNVTVINGGRVKTFKEAWVTKIGTNAWTVERNPYLKKAVQDWVDSRNLQPQDEIEVLLTPRDRTAMPVIKIGSWILLGEDS
jgi:hypothetical protein